jgi:tRNA 2-(methylsulfanyl)-N6-isopentenyladenosine37 hydroxylase
MLHLKAPTDASWLAQVDSNLEEVLIDHAHCEKKAAGTALNLIFHYVEDIELCREMTEIVNEELEHFHMVIDLLNRRGIRFRRLKPSQYGNRLHALIRKNEPDRAVDRLLVAGLIEARSCERFQALAEHVSDPELATFYRSLFESEARHHSTYTRLAKHFAPEPIVEARLEELYDVEAEIMSQREPLARMHS